MPAAFPGKPIGMDSKTSRNTVSATGKQYRAAMSSRCPTVRSGRIPGVLSVIRSVRL
jgi:hypothetical protein